MGSFFWTNGHIDWALFGIVVFSVLCLLVTDIVWRVARTSFRTLLVSVAAVWVIGVGALVAFYLA